MKKLFIEIHNSLVINWTACSQMIERSILITHFKTEHTKLQTGKQHAGHCFF